MTNIYIVTLNDMTKLVKLCLTTGTKLVLPKMEITLQTESATRK